MQYEKNNPPDFVILRLAALVQDDKIGGWLYFTLPHSGRRDVEDAVPYGRFWAVRPVRMRGKLRLTGYFTEKDLFISIIPLNFWKAFVIMEVAEKRELPNLSVF